MGFFNSILAKVSALSTSMEDTTLWEDIINYFNEGMELNNINAQSGLVSLPLVFLGLFGGAAVAAIVSVYNKRILGEFVHTLMREGCFSPESARDLDYLNYIYKGYIRNAVRRGTNLRRVVKCREEEEHNKRQAELLAEYEEKLKSGEKCEKFEPKEYRPDPYMDHFYIPEELKDAAAVKFDKKGSTLLSTVFTVCALAVAFVLMLLFFPQIMKFVDNFIGVLKG